METVHKHAARVTPVWTLADGENESWVRLFRAGPLVYEGEPMDVDADELELIASETNRLIANCERYAAEAGDDRTPWKPPIMAEHKSEGGKTYGRLAELKVRRDELFGRAQWKAATWEQVLAEDVEFVSPHVVGAYQDAKGEKYQRVLWETSLTTHPKLKDIGRIQDTMSIRLSDNYRSINKKRLEALMGRIRRK